MEEKKQERKKRKWDVPGPAPAAPPPIPAQPLGVTPLPVPAAVAGSPFFMGLGGQAGSGSSPAGLPGGATPDEIARKIKETLIQRGIIAGAKVEEGGSETEIVINDAPPAVRSQLTRRPVQEEIQRETGSVIITRGRYKAPGAPSDDTEKPLHLHISPGAHLPNENAKRKAVEHAVSVIQDILKGGPGLRPRQGIVRPAPAMHTMFLHVGIDADPSFGLAARIRGQDNAFLDHIANESSAVLELRGRESGTKEGPEGKEKDEPLQLVLLCSTAPGLEHAKKLATNLLDTIRADWEKHSKPAAPVASAASGAPSLPPPMYSPYYYGYPYPPYGGAPPPYGAAPPPYGYYPQPSPAAGSGPPASAPPATYTPRAASPMAPSPSEHYQPPPQAAPAQQDAAASGAYAGGPAAQQATQAAAYTSPYYGAPQDEKASIPPPPPESRPPPPQSPAQATASPAPYASAPQAQQHHQAPYSTHYGSPDAYQQYHSPAPPAASPLPPTAQASPVPPAEAAPPPPAEEAPPAPPAEASAGYGSQQYPMQGQPAHGQHPSDRSQDGAYAGAGSHPQPSPFPHQGYYSPQGQQPGQYGGADGAYSATAGGASTYPGPPNGYAPFAPPPAQQAALPAQPLQQRAPYAQAPPAPGAYAAQGMGQFAQGGYQQAPPPQQGPPLAYNGGGYSANPPPAYQPGGPGQQQQQPQQQQGAPAGEKKRKFQEFPTGGRSMPPANQVAPPYANQGPSSGFSFPQNQGAPPMAGNGAGLMGPPPSRPMRPPPPRGAMQAMGPPMNRPPTQSAQAHGIKLVDYGEEEDDDIFRGNPTRQLPHRPHPGHAPPGMRPFWHPRA